MKILILCCLHSTKLGGFVNYITYKPTKQNYIFKNKTDFIGENRVFWVTTLVEILVKNKRVKLSFPG